MEATSPILAQFSLRDSISLSPISLSQNSSFSSPCVTASLSLRGSSKRQLPHLKGKLLSNLRPVKASSGIPSPESEERWVLEPVGSGDSRHIGYKVPMPGAFEIASKSVTIGRLPEKADMVIPVGTVSGLHALIEKKEGVLLVTDLDSTNGTYVGEKKLRPGAPATVLPGSVITFGDIHLAMFRASKMENDDIFSKSDEVQFKTQSSAVNVESTT